MLTQPVECVFTAQACVTMAVASVAPSDVLCPSYLSWNDDNHTIADSILIKFATHTALSIWKTLYY